MTDPITHANTLAEIDGLKARIAALERERDEARAANNRIVYEALTLILVEANMTIDEAEANGGSPYEILRRMIAERNTLRTRNAALVEAVDASKELLEAYDGQMATCNDPEDGCAEQWSECVGRLRAALARAEAAVKGMNDGKA